MDTKNVIKTSIINNFLKGDKSIALRDDSCFIEEGIIDSVGVLELIAFLEDGSEYAAVIPKFIASVLTGKPPVIFGDGEQSRDFTFIRDVVAANILAAESHATGVFNIGRSERVTVNHLARVLIDLTGNAAIRPVHKEPRPDDVKHSLADITRARAFGYNPGYSLEQGLKETLKTFGRS